MFVASGEQQPTNAPTSISQIPAVVPEDVVFPLPEPIGQPFASAALWASTSQQGPALSTTIAEDPRADELVGLGPSASTSQRIPSFPTVPLPTVVSEPPALVAGVASEPPANAAAIQDSLQFVEKPPRVASSEAQLRSSLISSSSRPFEPSAASAARDVSADTQEDLVSMDSLRSMKMADLAQMLVGQTQGPGASASADANANVSSSTGFVDAVLRGSLSTLLLLFYLTTVLYTLFWCDVRRIILYDS